LNLFQEESKREREREREREIEFKRRSERGDMTAGT
jgi:hypothetical protein